MSEELESVFRALADPQRRRLLDSLRERDGQALNELEVALPEMTRFGVMKHLRVLEGAGLVTTRRQGRHKLHYLNPVPIQLIADRWISRYAAAWTGPMTRLKRELEVPPMATYRYEIYVAAAPEQVWRALTDPEQTRRYWHAARNRSEWRAGARWTSEGDDGTLYLEGEIIEIDAPRRLVHTFHVVHDPGAAAETPSRVTFEIEPHGEVSRLHVLHEGLGDATRVYVTGGWEHICSGLKTLLETGRPLAATSA